MITIRWLHLTDLHYGQKGQDHLWPNVREAFFERLARLHDVRGPWDLVLFTGDLVQTGKAKEFERLDDQVLGPLFQHLAMLGSKPMLLAVPGNHDLAWPDPQTDPSFPKALKPAVKVLTRDWQNDDEIRSEFWDDRESAYRQVVDWAFTNYRAWWQRCRQLGDLTIQQGILAGDFAATWQRGGVRIGIAGLNTTFLQLRGGMKPGSLAWDARQLHAVCGGDGPAWTAKHDLCLLLTHHPPGWLDQPSRQKAQGEIAPAGRFAVHLCGHQHENETLGRSHGGGLMRRVWQGNSLFGMEYADATGKDDRRHGFSIGEVVFEGDGAMLRQWPLKGFRDQNGWRFVRDERSCVLEEDGGTRPEPIQLYRERQTKTASRTLPSQPSSGQPAPAPPAPLFHFQTHYIPANAFVGRVEELGKLDDWARSDDPVLVLEAIGGIGKSNLAWEWLRTRAETVTDDLAGGVWWSFYESGTTFVSWVRRTLAHLTRQDPDELRQIPHEERLTALFEALERRPFLLVLDGLERALTAYHRLDPSKLRDDQVEGELRDCTQPRDDEVLRRLVTCGPSKALITSRLMPRALENRARRPLFGVRREVLDGLAPDDALELSRRLEISGDSSAIRAFGGKFGYHSLLLAIVAGLITDYVPAPGNFDRWIGDPAAGGALRLGELDLKQRRTHILEFALRGLELEKRRLLNRISVFSDAMDYETLKILSPSRPAATGEDAAAEEAFRTALSELVERRLVHWDSQRERYDLHPVVRGFAFDQLEDDEKVSTCDLVRSHFESLPPEDPNEATELADLARTLEIYRLLIEAKRWDRAVDLFIGAVSNALLFSVASYPTVMELLRPLFRDGLECPPRLESKLAQSQVMQCLAIAMRSTGQPSGALPLLTGEIEIALNSRAWHILCLEVGELGRVSMQMNRPASAVAALELAYSLARATKNKEEESVLSLALMAHYTVTGQWQEAHAAHAAFVARPAPERRAIYRPGGVEMNLCQLKLHQNKLRNEDLDEALRVAEQGRNTISQLGLNRLRAELALQNGDADAATESIERAIAIARKCGVPARSDLGRLARAQVHQGHHDDARRTIEDALALVSETHNRTALAAAEVYLELDEPDLARDYALRAFELAWADGPPHSFWWPLQRSRRVLERLGVAEPQLPPFDPSRIEKIPHEDAIRRAIEELENRSA